MAAVLATALSFAAAVAARTDSTATLARHGPRRMVCRWIVDALSGRPVCTWEPEEDSPRRHIPHPRLVWG